tara:strand:- start:142 stop:888 length:747 start_codon:yes stop_codon:yes gene_type:complete
MNKNILIIGLGEVGSAIKQVEEDAKNKVYVIDRKFDSDLIESYDVIHICLPYVRGFIDACIHYLKTYPCDLAIIHSTVSVGVTSNIQKEFDMPVVHSPIRGIHPKLYEGIKTFVKYVGGEVGAAEAAKTHLDSINIKTEILGCSKTTELAKILSTTYYGWNILFAKQVKKLCDLSKLDYDKVYKKPNISYNIGYKKLGLDDAENHISVIRPVLYPPKGKIGGHCITSNFDLLPDIDLKFIVKDLNEME